MNAISLGENSVIGCFVRVLVSCKQAVAMDDVGRDCCQGFAFEPPDDHIASFFYIFVHNFCRLYFTYAGNCAVEIIASRRAEQCNTNARLREAHRTARMRADNAAAVRERFVAHQMRRRSARNAYTNRAVAMRDVVVSFLHDQHYELPKPLNAKPATVNAVDPLTRKARRRKWLMGIAL